MIYGEEVKEIDTSQGLWLADDLDAVPDGYCANLVNMIKNDAGGWEVRPNFVPIAGMSSRTLATSAIGTQNESVDYYFNHILSKAFSSFDLEAPLTTHPLCLISTYNSTALTNALTWINKDGTAFADVGIAATGVTTSIAQYRDRHYATEFGSSTIFRYDFTSFGVARTTIQVITALGSVSHMVAFRDRMFAFAQRESRIYYTELAETGGYPENWNSSNNFFDLPDSGAIVRDAFVANDRLYLFTNVGVYQLYANGNPSNWQVIPVSYNIKVQSRGHVALINGVFIFTDMRSVFVYNGSGTVTEIGQPIKASFRPQVNDYSIPLDSTVQVYAGPSSVNIHPFLDGFILAQHFLGGSTPLTRTRVSKYYYFDGNVWTEIRFDDDVSGANKEHYQMIGTFRRKPLKASGEASKKFNDAIVEIRMNSSTTSMIVATRSVRADNTLLESNLHTNFGMFTKDINVGEPKLNRFKEIRIRSRSTLTDFTVSPYVDGTFSNSNVFTVTSGGGSRMHRGSVDIQRGNSIALAISGTVDRDTGLGGDQSAYSYPSFRLNNALVVCNTDTRNLPNQETVT